MSDDLETIIREVYSCYDVRYGNAIVDLKQRIDKAIRILNSAKNHYDNDKTNWAIERTLRVLKGSDNE